MLGNNKLTLGLTVMTMVAAGAYLVYPPKHKVPPTPIVTAEAPQFIPAVPVPAENGPQVVESTPPAVVPLPPPEPAPAPPPAQETAPTTPPPPPVTTTSEPPAVVPGPYLPQPEPATHNKKTGKKGIDNSEMNAPKAPPLPKQKKQSSSNSGPKKHYVIHMHGHAYRCFLIRGE